MTRREAALLVAAFVAAGVCVLSVAYIRPDSVAVVAWLRSAAIDGDFSFFDEWSMAGMVRRGVTMFSEVTPAGALANHWGVGTSVVTALPYALARPFMTDGFGGIAGAVLAWTMVAFALACCAIALWFTRGERNRAAALVAGVIGTPVFFYTFMVPIGTHLAGAFCVGLITCALFAAECGGGRLARHATGEPPVATLSSDAMAGFAAGAATGLAISTRLQHFMLVPAIAYAGVRHRRDRTWWLAAVGGGLLGLAPQLIAWNAVYGSPLGPVTSGAALGGTTWMPFQHVAMLAVLFSSYHGLFSWSPVIILAVAGWLRETRSHDAARRTLATTFLLMFAGEWIANGTFDRYFWGGTTFGGRRFVDLFVPIAIGLIWIARNAWIAAAELLLSLWTVALAAAANAGTLSLARYVSGGDLVRSVLAVRRVPLHSAIVDPSLAALTLPATLIVAVCAVAAFYLAKNSRRAVLAGAAMLVVATLGCAIAAVRTPAAAAADIQRLHIDVARSQHVGPLIDERTLLLDEIAWARATGDNARAAATSREVANIEQLLQLMR